MTDIRGSSSLDKAWKIKRLEEHPYTLHMPTLKPTQTAASPCSPSTSLHPKYCNEKDPLAVQKSKHEWAKLCWIIYEVRPEGKFR